MAPLTWSVTTAGEEWALWRGNVQVGAYSLPRRIYRTYDARSDTWGRPIAAGPDELRPLPRLPGR